MTAAYDVVFKRDAVSALRACDLREDLETGGALFGHVHGTTIEVVDATEAVAERGPQRALYDTGLLDEQMVERAKAGLDLVGLWHTHPGGNITPSPADETLWRSWAKCFAKGRPLIGAILARSNLAEPWTSASKSRAYVVTPEGDIKTGAFSFAGSVLLEEAS